MSAKSLARSAGQVFYWVQHKAWGLLASRFMRGDELGRMSCYPPALLIHSRYASACRSTTCCLRSLRNDRRFSTRSLSLANSLQTREQNREIAEHKQTQTKRRRQKQQHKQRRIHTNRQTDRRLENSVCFVQKAGGWTSPTPANCLTVMV